MIQFGMWVWDVGEMCHGGQEVQTLSYNKYIIGK